MPRIALEGKYSYWVAVVGHDIGCGVGSDLLRLIFANLRHTIVVAVFLCVAGSRKMALAEAFHVSTFYIVFCYSVVDDAQLAGLRRVSSKRWRPSSPRHS